MLTYVSAFISGELEPFWPHVWLLSFSVLASIAVGVGIIFERPKYSPSVHRVAFWLIVGGVIFEAICTIFLFVFDEGISRSQQSKIDAQQSKIIALETRLAPRVISPEQRERIIEKMKQFAPQSFSGRVAAGSEDAWDLWREISLALELAGWKKLPPVPPIGTPPFGPSATITEAAMPGVMVWFPGFGWNEFKPVADALAKALRDDGNGILAGSGGVAENTRTITIEIGPNPHEPASIYRDSPP
jgi:hypothetical protein